MASLSQRQALAFAGLVAGLTGSVRATTPQSTLQPTSGINFVVETGSSQDFDGTVQMFAGGYTPGSALAATGTSVSVASQQALFNRIGYTFGGSGANFNLPNLANAIGIGAGQGQGLTPRVLGATTGQNAVTLTTANAPTSLGGGGQSFSNMQPSLALNYYICTIGVYPSQSSGGGGGNGAPMIGSILASASPTAPNGYIACAGQTLQISQNQAMFGVLGITYGGNGTSNFAVPDLRGRTPIGAGAGSGLSSRALGSTVGTETTTLTAANYYAPYGSSQSYSNMQPSLALNYIIALNGIYPTRDGGGDNFDGNVPVLGQVEMFAGTFAPAGWAFCAGQTLSIAQNTALFSLLGTQYGGDGRSTFKLPDLQGRAAMGDSLNLPIENGMQQGTESITATFAELPTATPEPTSLALAALSTTTLLARRRRQRVATAR